GTRRPATRRRAAGYRARLRSQGGMVTAEIAMAIPAIVAVIMLGIWAVSVVVADLRCDDAAREAARAVARGEPMSVVEEITDHVGPDRAIVAIRQEDGLVVVEVAFRVAFPGPFDSPAIEVMGDAVAVAETP